MTRGKKVRMPGRRRTRLRTIRRVCDVCRMFCFVLKRNSGRLRKRGRVMGPRHRQEQRVPLESASEFHRLHPSPGNTLCFLQFASHVSSKQHLCSLSAPSSIAYPLYNNRDMPDENQPASGPFEGPEKLLEIWFEPSPAHVPDASSTADGKFGLRRVPSNVWAEMLDIVKCKILSVVQGKEMDAYLLRSAIVSLALPHSPVWSFCQIIIVPSSSVCLNQPETVTRLLPPLLSS